MNDLHGERLIRRQGVQVREIGFDEHDAVVAVAAP